MVLTEALRARPKAGRRVAKADGLGDIFVDALRDNTDTVRGGMGDVGEALMGNGAVAGLRMSVGRVGVSGVHGMVTGALCVRVSPLGTRERTGLVGNGVSIPRMGTGRNVFVGVVGVEGVTGTGTNIASIPPNPEFDPATDSEEAPS